MTEAAKDPNQIEKEADQARSQLKQTVDALSARLSPGQLLDQAMGMTKEHGGAFAKNLGGQVKQNPLALLLTGIGALWLMIGSGRQATSTPSYDGAALGRLNTSTARHDEQSGNGSFKERLGDKAQSAKASAHDKTSSLKASASEQKARIKEQADELKSNLSSSTDSIKDRGSSATESAQEMASSAQQAAAEGQDQLMAQATAVKVQVDSLMKEQPLIAGALGVALGAAIGALVPPSDKEDQLMGRHSDSLKTKTLSEADRQYSTARDNLSQKAEEASASVERTVKQAKSEMADHQPA